MGTGKKPGSAALNPNVRLHPQAGHTAVVLYTLHARGKAPLQHDNVTRL